MTQFLDHLRTLHRPRLLIRAARHGVTEYSRNRDLRRIFRAETLPSPATAVPRLMELEAEMEGRRTDGTATYSAMRHIEVLIALMAEARLLL